MDVGCSDRDRHETIWRAIDYVYSSGVVGDIAEFGVYSGASANVLAQAMRTLSQRRKYSDRMHGISFRSLHLFDSFEGFPEIGEEDAASPHCEAGVWKQRSGKGSSAAEIRQMIGQHIDHDRLAVHHGWFKDTLPALDARFALVHIDCDLYESTRDVLDNLLGRGMMTDGCVMLFDDWDCNRASPVFGERRAFAEAHDHYGFSFSDCGSYGSMSHRFIYHAG